ncbi:hypothetical protein SDC9_191502 [bioreactor metagenome]|uniref:Uncharacterized protein n=1 Tax=bioreactor metagenome TaxID=1076179 RepID=A0A645HY24_9ZZZZ
MNVIIIFLRQIKVENNLNVADIDSACRDIGRNQSFKLTLFETVHDLGPLCLFHVTVQSLGLISANTKIGN